MLLKVFQGETFHDCEEKFNWFMGKNENATIHNVGFHNRDGKPAEITILYSFPTAPKIEPPRVITVPMPSGRNKI
jgi:hypothetical protein